MKHWSCPNLSMHTGVSNHWLPCWMRYLSKQTFPITDFKIEQPSSAFFRTQWTYYSKRSDVSSEHRSHRSWCMQFEALNRNDSFQGHKLKFEKSLNNVLPLLFSQCNMCFVRRSKRQLSTTLFFPIVALCDMQVCVTILKCSKWSEKIKKRRKLNRTWTRL